MSNPSFRRLGQVLLRLAQRVLGRSPGAGALLAPSQFSVAVAAWAREAVAAGYDPTPHPTIFRGSMNGCFIKIDTGHFRGRVYRISVHMVLALAVQPLAGKVFLQRGGSLALEPGARRYQFMLNETPELVSVELEDRHAKLVFMGGTDPGIVLAVVELLTRAG